MKARDGVYDGKKELLFELGSDSEFSIIYTMYNIGERSKP